MIENDDFEEDVGFCADCGREFYNPKGDELCILCERKKYALGGDEIGVEIW